MFAAAGLMLATPSCKKGENDPALSFSSRKARISNAWTVSAISETWTNTDSDGDSWSSTESFDGTTKTVVNSSTSGGTTWSNTSTYTYSDFSITIEKDGTFEMVEAYTYQDVDDSWSPIITTTDYTVNNTMSGTWSFIGKAKDNYKNKERVIFNILNGTYSNSQTAVTVDGSGTTLNTSTSSSSSTDVESHGESTMVFDIDMLKGKEMVWMQQFDGSSSDSNTSGSTTVTTSDTYTGSSTWTLMEK